jgi:acid phosphatase (class A)
MKATRRHYLLGAIWLAFVASGATWWWHTYVFHYLPGETTEFVALFAPPPAPDSTETRAELAELLDLQRTRTPADVTAAQADRKKDVARFYAALGVDAEHPPRLPRLESLIDDVEHDIGPYVRAAKKKFLRLRPFEIEPQLEPCIDDVKGDQSYPSGHATYGYVVARVLSQLVPERQLILDKRADEFARQRMMCGVHFRSDLEAGRKAAQWLASHLEDEPAYIRDANAAMRELRAALNLPARPPRPE